MNFFCYSVRAKKSLIAIYTAKMANLSIQNQIFLVIKANTSS